MEPSGRTVNEPPGACFHFAKLSSEPSKISSAPGIVSYSFHAPPSTRYSVVARPLPPSSVASSVTVTGPLA